VAVQSIAPCCLTHHGPWSYGSSGPSRERLIRPSNDEDRVKGITASPGGGHRCPPAARTPTRPGADRAFARWQATAGLTLGVPRGAGQGELFSAKGWTAAVHTAGHRVAYVSQRLPITR
jgi:hypothetical protein